MSVGVRVCLCVHGYVLRRDTDFSDFIAKLSCNYDHLTSAIINEQPQIYISIGVKNWGGAHPSTYLPQQIEPYIS